MNKSKLTLIVDGNWVLMSRLAVLNNRYADDDELCRELQLMIIKSINVVLRTFQNIDNIIFVADGGSWRKNLEKPECVQIDYKVNRVLDPTTNWDMIFKYYEELITLLNENGITTCKMPLVEGDDWCWYWSKKLNSEGTNCIIWSMDKDLTQLVHTDDETGVFTCCWNKNGATVEDVDYSEGSDMGFFFGDLGAEKNKTYLHDIITHSVKVNKIKPKTVVIDKIIRGDAGDDILPIMQRHSKNNPEKLMRIYTKDLDLDLDIHNQEAIRTYISNLLNMKTYAGLVDKTEDEIVEHFNYNVKLVTLEKQSYPETVLNDMCSYTGYNCNKDISGVSSYITAKSNNLSSVLELL